MLSANGVQAQDSVGQLLPACKGLIDVSEGRNSTISDYDLGKCQGYIQGWIDAVMIWKSADPKVKICFPGEVTRIQAVRVFVKWADDHPAVHHLPMSAGTASAFRAAFPCQ